jgi:galactokinase/mevalonate kinase-like predicted kinase
VTEIKGITGEIQKALQAYAYNVSNEITEAKDDVSKTFKKDVENDSPELTGSYEKGWRIKKFKKSNIIYNKTDYQLTHLLEHGHVKINGGRTDARIHIRPNEEKSVKEFLKRVEKAVKK